MRTTHKKTAGVIGLLVLGALACGQLSIGIATPTPEVPPMPPQTVSSTPAGTNPTPIPPTLVTENPLLSLELSLAPELAAGTTRLSSWNSDNGLWEVRLPEFTVYTLNGYPVQDALHQPQIYILRVADLEELDEFTAGNLDKLRSILDEKPELGAYPAAGVDEPAYYLPGVPVFNAGQVMHAQAAYLDFQNGSGVRYLTQYAQAVGPVDNAEMVYVFQGLTQDGKFYVACAFPINHPGLLAGPNDVPEGGADTFIDLEKFEIYMEGVVGMLEEGAPSSFTPGLTRLDALVESMSVAQE